MWRPRSSRLIGGSISLRPRSGPAVRPVDRFHVLCRILSEDVDRGLGERNSAKIAILGIVSGRTVRGRCQMLRQQPRRTGRSRNGRSDEDDLPRRHGEAVLTEPRRFHARQRTAASCWCDAEPGVLFSRLAWRRSSSRCSDAGALARLETSGTEIRAVRSAAPTRPDPGSVRGRISARGPSSVLRRGDRQQVGSLVERVADVPLDPVPANLLVV